MVLCLRAEMKENGRLVQFLYNEDREVVAEKDCSSNIIRYICGLGLNLYTYCQNNPIRNHDPTGHGTKENSSYSKKSLYDKYKN